MDDAAHPRPASLLRLFAFTVWLSVLHAPLALLLAVASLALMVGGVMTLGGETPEAIAIGAAGAWLLASHALFIAFLGEFLAPRQPLGARFRRAGAGSKRALPHLSLLLAAATALAIVLPLSFPVTWAAATFLSLPRHFAHHGWAGWRTPPAPSPVRAWRRLAVMTPSLLLFALVTRLLSGPGASWGFMDGGVGLAALLAGLMFWASFSCAIFSAAFAGPYDRRAGIR